MNTIEQLLDKLTKAVSYKFKEDGTSPNITISKLRKGYYCSVVRYPKGSSTKSKVVVCKAHEPTLQAAVLVVADQFLKLAQVELNPVQELEKFWTDNSNTTTKNSK